MSDDLVPPVFLVERIGGPQGDGDAWKGGFVRIGRESLREWERALEAVSRPLDSFVNALEWGCGPGRVLLPLLQDYPKLAITAVDPDRGSVEWLQTLGLSAVIETINFDPPTRFGSQEFEIVLSHSVLTHLGEDDQRSWLNEIARLLVPGGLFVTSLHGNYAFSLAVRDFVGGGDDPAQWTLPWKDKGHLFADVDENIGGAFSERYRSMFQIPASIEALSEDAFRILAVFSRGALGFQDLVVLQRLTQQEQSEQRSLLAPLRSPQSNPEPTRPSDERTLAILTNSVNHLGRQIARLEDEIANLRREFRKRRTSE